MKNKTKLYFELFKSTFVLSASTFGGGYVIVPLMRKKFVQEYEWIEENEMLDLIALAQSSPGAMAVNASILIGYRMAGIIGSLVTVLGTVLPPLLIITVISVFYDAFKANWLANTFMIGMRSGVAAMIFDVVIKMFKGVIKDRNATSIIIILITLIMSSLFKISISYFLLFGGFVGLMVYQHELRKLKGANNDLS